MNEHDFIYMNKETLGHILDWCVNRYGHSKFVKHALLKYRINNRISAKGFFYPDEVIIEVNGKGHRSLVDFVHTVIHEYQHYLQDQDLYDKYSNEFDDDNNPLEIEADKVAIRDKNKCLRKIVKIIDYERFIG